MVEDSRDKESDIKELVEELGFGLLMDGKLKPSSNIYRPNQFDMTNIASQISNKSKEPVMIYIKYSEENKGYVFEIYEKGFLNIF
ncbi:hypothetical protein KAS08_03990 [Candidatus Pacearchaeota archaeon]|nr:hypothetical protein [Candidatus Pacearchaeota archaeon]